MHSCKSLVAQHFLVFPTKTSEVQIYHLPTIKLSKKAGHSKLLDLRIQVMSVLKMWHQPLSADTRSLGQFHFS